MTRLVQDMLAASARRVPDRVALVCGAKRWTYRELDERSNQVAAALRRLGVGRGDRVGVFLPNCAEAVAGLFGVLKAGGVFVMIHPSTKREKLEFILRDCGAAALLADRALLGQLAREEHPTLRGMIVRERGPAPAAPAVSAAPEGPEAARERTFDDVFRAEPVAPQGGAGIDLDLACLIYTSGSTGEAKGVMCDHANVLFVTRSIVDYLRNTESDVVLSVLPLSFSYGLYQLMAMVCVGGRLVLEDSFAFPAVILKKIAAEQVTGFPSVPTVYAILLGLDLSTFDLSSLRYLTNAAAALPVDHVRRLRERFPRAELFLMHGLTEVARTVYLPPDQVDARPDAVGGAIPGTEVWLEDESGRRLGPGEVGELVVRGRHVMRGYWNNPEATAARFRPGPIPGERLCYSGDLFRMDADGYLYFVSRSDDIIKCRGEKVSPREVENVLYGIPGVTEAAVIGVPDPVFGEAVKAFVVAPGLDLSVAQVLAHCKAHLEDILVPKHVEFRETLPKTPTGKIRKVDLR